MEKIELMKRILILLAASTIIFSCSKSSDENEICFNGVVRWAGSPAADGLGWVIYKDDSTTTQPFIPKNLSGNYTKDGLIISVCLVKTAEKFHCFCTQPLPVYRITSINPR